MFKFKSSDNSKDYRHVDCLQFVQKNLELKKCEQRFYIERKKVTCFHECLWE